MAAHYTDWPKITEFCAVAPFNGLMEKRGGALIDIDRNALESRMRDYFDSDLSWDEYKARQTALTEDAARCNAKDARAKTIATESFDAGRFAATRCGPLRPAGVTILRFARSGMNRVRRFGPNAGTAIAFL